MRTGKSKVRIALLSAVASAILPAPGSATDKLTYHHDAGRTGWNANEVTLTPASVASDRFGLLWQSPPLDEYEGVPPRLFATPLYVSGTAFVVTTAGYAYAINTAQSGDMAPGAILWRKRLTDAPCAKGEMGNLATPVIDRARRLLERHDAIERRLKR